MTREEKRKIKDFLEDLWDFFETNADGETTGLFEEYDLIYGYIKEIFDRDKKRADKLRRKRVIKNTRIKRKLYEMAQNKFIRIIKKLADTDRLAYFHLNIDNIEGMFFNDRNKHLVIYTKQDRHDFEYDEIQNLAELSKQLEALVIKQPENNE